VSTDDPFRDDDVRVPDVYGEDVTHDDHPEAEAYDAGMHEPRLSFPWPPPENESIIGAYGRTWRGAALQPGQFFSAMPAEGSIRSALLYYLPLGIAVAGANLFWTLLRGGVETEQEAVLGEMPLGGAVSPLVEFLFSPIILLLSLFLAAGITHLMLKLFGGANRSFGFTTRVFAFAYSPQILGVIPVAGAIFGFIWMVVVAIIGLKEGHRTTTARAASAVLIPVTFALIFIAIAAFVAASGRLLLQ
jgi:hypothetical protein